MLPDVRNAVRAVIVRNGAVLVQEKSYENGVRRYTLPGGAPVAGETLEAGLQRECREEIGATVEVVDLMHVADFYKPRDTDPPTQRHQIEFIFRCHVPDDYVAGNGLRPDKHQVDVVWLPLQSQATDRLFPRRLRQLLTESSRQPPIYLGLID